MRFWFSSDTHYFHDNIIKYCNRPFRDVNHMNKEMAQRWNDVVKENDVAIILGDLSAGLKDKIPDFSNLVKNLKGKKILVRGNHDHLPDSWYESCGILKVIDYVNLDGVLLVHYPIEDAKKRFPKYDWGVVEHVVHGHVHHVDTDDFDGHFNVSVDRNGFFPVSVDMAVPEKNRDKFCESILNFTAIK